MKEIQSEGPKLCIINVHPAMKRYAKHYYYSVYEWHVHIEKQISLKFDHGHGIIDTWWVLCVIDVYYTGIVMNTKLFLIMILF